MVDGKHCPACGRDIGVWAVVSAGLPNWIKCPHCFTRVKCREIGGVVLVLAFVMIVVLTAGHFAVTAISPQHVVRFDVYLLVLCGAWVPVEFVTVWFLRGNRQLALYDDSTGNPPHSHT